jgi:TonB family protein
MPTNLRFALLSLAMLVNASATVLVDASAQEASTPPPAQQSQPGSDAGAPATGGGTGAEPENVSKPAYRVGRDVLPPKVLYDPDPPYSEVARRAGYQATVVLGLVVGTDGRGHRIRVQHGAGMGLDQQALETVKLWRFEPATKDGQPVPVLINIEVNFRLNAHSGESPLSSFAEANKKPPNFPGVDVAKYPLVVHIGNINGLPVGDSYEIVAQTTIDSATSEQSLSISCSGKKDHCPFLGAGNYPAKWKSEGQQLEILGQEKRDGPWKKAEYTVSPDAPTRQSTNNP